MRDRYRHVGAISDRQLHDLKNRLAVIKGMSQLLARQVRKSDWDHARITARVDHLEGEIVRLEALVNELGQSQPCPRWHDTDQPARRAS
jgi:nitrogen-specific signal transduction histidine kinase